MKSEQISIGIDIGGTNVRAARVTASGRILEAYSERTVRDAPALLGLIVALVHKVDRPDMRTIGVGIPGRVDTVARAALSGGYVDLCDRQRGCRG